MRFLHSTLLLAFAFVFFQLKFDKGSLLLGQTTQYDIVSSTDSDTSLTRISIDSLAIGQSYFLNLKSNGCFHHTYLHLVISKELTGYFASFKMDGQIEGNKVDTKFKKSRLNNFQVDTIRNFEKQLILISSVKHNCTTVDNYTLSINKKSNSYIVDDCNWSGFSRLIGYLFRKPNNR